MPDFKKIAEKQLRDQIEMGFFVINTDEIAEGEQKVIEDQKNRIRADIMTELEDNKIKVRYTESEKYNFEIASQIAEEFIKKLPGSNKNKIDELKKLIIEGLTRKNLELKYKLHSLKSIEDVRLFTDKLFTRFEIIDQQIRDGRYLRETKNTLTIRFPEKNARNYQNRNKKNFREIKMEEFKNIIFSCALDVNLID